jgi:hypothetical protein
MPFQVSRTDTGQFVLIDPTTDTVVIDDDLAQGFAKLEHAVASKPASAPAPSSPARTPSTFEFRGGPRYTPILLAVVLPFAWLAVMYFALANLLSETAVGGGAARDTEAKLEQLERELQALRSEVAGAPRTAKTKPTRKPEQKQPDKPASEELEPDDEDVPEGEAAPAPPEAAQDQDPS